MINANTLDFESYWSVISKRFHLRLFTDVFGSFLCASHCAGVP